MKKIKMKKLSLNKETVTTLSENKMTQIEGGKADTVSNQCIWLSINTCISYPNGC